MENTGNFLTYNKLTPRVLHSEGHSYRPLVARHLFLDVAQKTNGITKLEAVFNTTLKEIIENQNCGIVTDLNIYKLDNNLIRMFIKENNISFNTYQEMFECFAKNNIDVFIEVFTKQLYTNINKIARSNIMYLQSYPGEKAEIMVSSSVINDVFKIVGKDVSTFFLNGPQDKFVIEEQELKNILSDSSVLVDNYKKYNKSKIRSSVFLKNKEREFEKWVNSNEFNPNHDMFRFSRPFINNENSSEAYMFCNPKRSKLPLINDANFGNCSTKEQINNISNRIHSIFGYNCSSSSSFVNSRNPNFGSTGDFFNLVELFNGQENNIFYPVFPAEIYFIKSTSRYVKNLNNVEKKENKKDLDFMYLNKDVVTHKNEIMEYKYLFPTFMAPAKTEGSVNDINNIHFVKGLLGTEDIYPFDEYAQKSFEYFNECELKETKKQEAIERKLLKLF